MAGGPSAFSVTVLVPAARNSSTIAAVAALTGQLTGTGIRIDADPAPAGTPSRGLRARDRYLTSDQRVALHRLRRLPPPMGARAAAILDVIARDPRALTECHRDLDPEVVIALQQRGIIRRHPRGDYLELTDDAQFSLAPEMPHLSRSEH